MFKSLFTILVLNVLPTLKAVRSPGVGLVIFSELSATVMIGGVLVIGIFGHFNFIYVSYLIVLIEAVFAFIEKVVVALTGKVDKNTSSKSILILLSIIKIKRSKLYVVLQN